MLLSAQKGWTNINRLNRDQILVRGLDMVDSPSLDTKDRPSGAIIAGALSVGWLQDALDLFHNEFPWAGTVKSTAITLDTTGLVSVPADFILDVRNGITLPAPNQRRLARLPLQKLISYQLADTTAGVPRGYTVTEPDLRIFPMPDKSYSATLWYYALPTVLSANTLPKFPSDWVLVEYVRLRGLEWLQKIAPGSAMAYAREQIAALRKSGLAGEPEDDEIPLDPLRFRPAGPSAPWDWMGKTVVG